MRIIEVFSMNNQIIAYCVGEDLPTSFKCKKILVSGKSFEVLNSGSTVALCGQKNALMALKVTKPEDVPLGTFTILQ